MTAEAPIPIPIALLQDVRPIRTTIITTEDTIIREDQEEAETATAEAPTPILIILLQDVRPIRTTIITTEGTTIREDREEAGMATAEALTPAVLLQDPVPEEIPEETAISKGMRTEGSLLQKEAVSEAEVTAEAVIPSHKPYRPAV